MPKLRSLLSIVFLTIGIIATCLAVPVFWLWVVSQLTTKPSLSSAIAAIFIVAVLATWGLLTWGLLLLNEWERRRRRMSIPYQRYAWLRPRGLTNTEERAPVTYIETAAICAAFLLMIVLLIWFFVFAGSPLPKF